MIKSFHTVNITLFLWSILFIIQFECFNNKTLFKTAFNVNTITYLFKNLCVLMIQYGNVHNFRKIV